MPNKIVIELMEQVSKLAITVTEVKTDLGTLKKLVFMAVGAGFTGIAGIFVQIVMSWGR